MGPPYPHMPLRGTVGRWPSTNTHTGVHPSFRRRLATCTQQFQRRCFLVPGGCKEGEGFLGDGVSFPISRFDLLTEASPLLRFLGGRNRNRGLQPSKTWFGQGGGGGFAPQDLPCPALPSLARSAPTSPLTPRKGRGGPGYCPSSGLLSPDQAKAIESIREFWSSAIGDGPENCQKPTRLQKEKKD